MANKYERRRRSLKGSPARGESAFAPPRSLSAAGAGHHRAGRGVVIAICCLLVLGIAVVFAQTTRHGFVNCDDNEYIYENLHIQRGLTPASAWWAITEAHSANWHPLTWIAHTIDWQVFGVWDADRQRYVDSWPGGHHLVNVLLHAVCAVLLFLIMQEMTGATWPSAVVAALFAIHPLRAESVAWVTERKDMLSGLFFLATLAAYRAYAARPFSWWRYGLVAASFALGLTAKPMLVTLPLVLLLLDYWPLGRVDGGRSGHPRSGSVDGRKQNHPPSTSFLSTVHRPPSTSFLRLIVEKMPLLALSAGSCFLTMWAQRLVGALKPLDFQYRAGNALVSCAAYIGQMFCPVGMVVQYVHPGPNIRLVDTLIPLAVLVLITLAVVWLGWRRRYLPVGWFWYLGMLVPVIGLVQAGAQARADRYTYLTQIGLYIMLAWGLSDLAQAWRGRTTWYAAAAAPIFAALAAGAWMQTSYWRNSLALWEHGVACQETNDYAQNEYGQALADAGRVDEAMKHYARAVEINPRYLTPWINYAVILQKQGKSAEALQVCDNALQVDPDDGGVHFIKAVTLFSLKQPDQSIREFRIAIAKNPKNELAHNNLAEVLRLNRREDEALEECRTALELKPELPEGHRTMANILLAKHDLDGAIEHFQTALKFRPDDALVQEGLAKVLLALDARAASCAATGDFAEAAATIRKAMEIPPGRAPQVAAKLQERLMLYQAHQKPALSPP